MSEHSILEAVSTANKRISKSYCFCWHVCTLSTKHLNLYSEKSSLTGLWVAAFYNAGINCTYSANLIRKSESYHKSSGVLDKNVAVFALRKAMVSNSGLPLVARGLRLCFADLHLRIITGNHYALKLSLIHI